MSAIISENGLYRYRLERDLGGSGPTACVIMVNPSTADAEQDDATIRKLKGFGQRLGWGRIIVGNVFAYRATDVKELRHVSPWGPENREHLKDMMGEASVVVFAWGPLSKLPRPYRGAWRTVSMCLRHAVPPRDHRTPLTTPMCWGKASDGHPRHPLMVAYNTPLTPWSPP